MSFTIYSFHSTVFIKCLLSSIWGHTKINKTKVLPSRDLQSGRRDRQSKGYSAVWQVSGRNSAQWVNVASGLLSSDIFTPFPTYTSHTRSTDIYHTCYLRSGLSSNCLKCHSWCLWKSLQGQLQVSILRNTVSDFPELVVSTYILP